ncbi:hypothetical protein BVC71_02785 [Marivivens niveibacter]|uniref:Glycosyl transferase family 1 n=1 Tax=Marivivens niveibacter TaxID=1930667 RepID=A0A251X299_9RHOB|nr:glycosyltransferase family 4 protein [Marivivens niveibacter]OUD10444.1 hypothetical protein BVC71_02785 [Marivivens niveibacter]
MKILILHNSYKQRGGEDTVVEQEEQLLKSGDHEVKSFRFSNDSISGNIQKIITFASIQKNHKSVREVINICEEFKPDVVHIHNFFPLLSPAAHIAAAKSGAAVVQTLHNFRLLCAGAMFLRDGVVCEDCLGNSRLAAIKNSCYRDSKIASAAVVAMQRATLGSENWLSSVDKFIALTEFGKSKFIQGGLPPTKIAVKPNFVSSIDPGPPIQDRQGSALFVGRLSSEKGVRRLVEAWKSLPDVPLDIVGSGPEENWLRENAPPHVSILGAKPRNQVIEKLQNARLLVFPSIWYEGFPMTIAEALACGTPILAANIGAAHEILNDEKCGALYKSDDSLALIKNAATLLNGDLQRKSVNARERFEGLYSAETNLKLIEDIYVEAIANRNRMVR